MIPDSHMHQIMEKIKTELVRSIKKHGMWDDMNYQQMIVATVDEAIEVDTAHDNNDIHGEHGIFNEAAQTASCCIKLMYQILKREVESANI